MIVRQPATEKSPVSGWTVTLAHLGSFAALARWRKQAAAEAALGKSQSQISRDLAALERAMGMRLLDRRARTLTAAGQRVLDYAGEVLRGWENLRGEALGEAGSVGQAVLAAEPEVLHGVLVPMLGELRRKYPGLEVRLVVRAASELKGMLAAGEADVAVLPAGDGGGAGLAARPFLTARVLVAVPAAWAVARRVRVGLASLRGRTLLVPGPGSSLREAVEAVLARGDIRRAMLCEIGPGRDAVLAAAAVGLGAGFLMAFEGVGDPLPHCEQAKVVLRPAGPEFRPLRYQLAIRKSLSSSGAGGLLVRELLRAVRGRN